MKQDKDYALIEVSHEGKKGALSMLAIMLGFTFFSASMMAGGTLGTSLSTSDFIKAIIIGNLMLGVYTGLLGYIGAKTGLSTHLLARYSFGSKGSYLGSFLLSVTEIGWFGVGVAMFALPVHKLTGIDIYILVYISGALMTATAYFGIKALTIISIIAVPAVAILGGASVISALNDIGGMEGISKIQPKESMAMETAISICIGSFIAGGTLTPDFARFSKTKTIGVVSSVVAFFIGNSLMFIFGAVGGKVFGTADISEVMLAQGFLIPAILVLGLNIWTTCDNALYCSGLGFSNITKIKKNKLVIFNGIAGTFFAITLYDNFIGFLSFLNTMIPAIGGIIIADYFILRKAEYQELEKKTFQSINIVAISSWVVAVVASQHLPGIPPLNGVLVAIASYVIGMFFYQKLVLSKRKDKINTTQE